MKGKVYSYKDLIVWQKAMQLVEEIYLLTGKFPKTKSMDYHPRCKELL